MKHTIEASWQGNMAFRSVVGEHTVVTDAPASMGGDDSGASPKKLMLVALAGCTGIDVAMILRKMRVQYEGLTITVEAELTDGEPALYTSMHLIYRFTGQGLVYDKLKKAVELSQEKYCGVSMMYQKMMKISWEIVITD